MSEEPLAKAKPSARVEVVPQESSSQPFKFTVHVYGPDTPEHRKLAEGLAAFAIRDKYGDNEPGATVNDTIIFEE